MTLFSAHRWKRTAQILIVAGLAIAAGGTPPMAGQVSVVPPNTVIIPPRPTPAPTPNPPPVATIAPAIPNTPDITIIPQAPSELQALTSPRSGSANLQTILMTDLSILTQAQAREAIQLITLILEQPRGLSRAQRNGLNAQRIALRGLLAP
jgi:hypothetical protein